jgi:hypothetical protein
VTAAVAGIVAAYAVLALLLLSLNLPSLWRWWIKAAAIVVTIGFFGITYQSVNGVMGWPTTDKPPPRFNLVSSRIVEPDRKSNTLGGIYIWAEALDQNNVPARTPRSYHLPYSDALARKVAGAQEKRDRGIDVMGTFDDDGRRRAEDAGKTIKMGQIQKDGEQTAATDTVPFREDSASISFEELPPVILPDKGPL